MSIYHPDGPREETVLQSACARPDATVSPSRRQRGEKSEGWMIAVFHRFLYCPLLYYTVFFCYCMSVCAAFSECVEKDFAHTSLQKSRPSVSAFLSAVQLKPTKTVSV